MVGRLAMVKLVMVLVCALLSLMTADEAVAAEQHPYTIAVYGDSLADGVWSGLYQLLRSRGDIVPLRHSAVGARLTRSDFESWMTEVDKQLDAQPLDFAVIMFGANDQTGLRDEAHHGFAFQTEGWRSAYAARVARLLGDLRDRHIKAVWVGLPILRDADLNAGAAYLNTLFAEVTARSGATFVSLEGDFTDEKGAFSLYRTDASNRTRQIRLEDGTHFTGFGYELVARKVIDALPIRQALLAAYGGLPEAAAGSAKP